MAFHIYSTLANTQHYTMYDRSKDKNQLPRVKAQIMVHGGANVSNKQFVTPKGVMTTVSDEEYELLKDNHVFKQHVANGHIQVESRKYSLDKVVKDMTEKDKSAPLTPDDYSKRIPVVPGSDNDMRPKASTRKVA
ncbi:MAG: hypothetical protein KGL39_23615 [Patescibacteria group bacterium]|nr:hypothetical protein [Patescibacteria group bacterium]